MLQSLPILLSTSLDSFRLPVVTNAFVNLFLKKKEFLSSSPTPHSLVQSLSTMTTPPLTLLYTSLYQYHAPLKMNYQNTTTWMAHSLHPIPLKNNLTNTTSFKHSNPLIDIQWILARQPMNIPRNTFQPFL